MAELCSENLFAPLELPFGVFLGGFPEAGLLAVLEAPDCKRVKATIRRKDGNIGENDRILTLQCLLCFGRIKHITKQRSTRTCDSMSRAGFEDAI